MICVFPASKNTVFGLSDFTILCIVRLCKFLHCRTNSDSALHQSTLTPAQQASFTGGSQELQSKRGTKFYHSDFYFH